MNQRGMGAAGAIAAMVVAGLIVYGLIFYGPSIWHRIQEGVGGIGGSGVSPIEIKQHPEKYLGETVTVEGWYDSALGISPVNPVEVDTPDETMKFFQGSLLVILPKNALVFQDAKYHFIGIVVVENDVFGHPTPKLDVSEVKPV